MQNHHWSSRLSVVLAGVLACVIAHAQSQPDEKAPDTANGTISGRVVNQNGQPLANAQVYISDYGDEAHTFFTDAEGNFKATGLRPVAYLISVSVPAYVQVPRDPDLNPIGYYHIGEVVRLEMMKGGVITGTVKRANGEPVVSISVRATMVRDSKGRPARPGFSIREQRTDDRGVYRIYGLTPGTYVIATRSGYRSPYSVQPYEDDSPTYAPSSTREMATEVTVGPGEEYSDIDIRYRDESGHSVSGAVKIGADPSRGSDVTLVSGLNTAEQTNYSTYQYPNTSGFVIAGVPDGEYHMIAQTFSPASNAWSVSELRRIKVSGADVTGIELSVRSLASISGAVVLQDSKTPECAGKRRPNPGEIVISAWHNEKNAADAQPQFIWGFGGPVTAGKEGNFTLRNLAAGQYRFVTHPLAKYWYLRSISWAGSATGNSSRPGDAARNWTTVKNAEQLASLSIVFAAGAGSIEGRLEPAPGQKLSPRTFVYVAPGEPEKREDVLRYFVTLAADDGSFALGNLPPGRYWITARAAGETDTNMLSKLRTPDEIKLRAQILQDATNEKIQIELKPCQNVTDYKLTPKP